MRRNSCRRTWVALTTCILLFTQGCVSDAQLSGVDIYTRNILFTVPVAPPQSNLVGAFSSTPLQAEADRSQNIILRVLSLHNLRLVSQFAIEALNVKAVVAEIGPRQKLNDVINALNADQRVQSVQQVQPYTLMTYNDPYFSLQSTVNGDRIEHIHAMTTGKDVIVGIIDTGVDRLHPDLAQNIVYARNFVEQDQGSFDLDEHGTAIAGVIASAANNEMGIVGVAPDVRLMVFKACQQELVSRRTSCDSVSIIKALNDVLVQRPDILNLSLSGPRNLIIEGLLKMASNEGIVLIAAIDEARVSADSFPANMDEVIAVGTSLAFKSNVAGVVLAPGTDMLTTAPGATYGFKSGSSIATAYVSGIAALMMEKAPYLTSEQIYAYLRNSSRLDENEMPVVDMCVAINDVANTIDSFCNGSRSVAAIGAEGPASVKNNEKLTN